MVYRKAVKRVDPNSVITGNFVALYCFYMRSWVLIKPIMVIITKYM